MNNFLLVCKMSGGKLGVARVAFSEKSLRHGDDERLFRVGSNPFEPLTGFQRKGCPELLQERPQKREHHINVPILRLSVSLPNIWLFVLNIR